VLGWLTGDGGVIRGGAGKVYDRFGSNIVTVFDNSASFGLSEIVRGPTINFTTGQRYLGTLPTIAAAPCTRSPTRRRRSIRSAVATWASPVTACPVCLQRQPFGGASAAMGMTAEVGYVGRWGRDLLMQIDEGGWAILFKDPASGQSWKEMAHRFAATRTRALMQRASAPTRPGAADSVHREHDAGAARSLLQRQRHRQLLQPDLGPERRQ
jgi:hypothetical protein